MANRSHVSETPATAFLKQHGVACTGHPYAYEEHGGTEVSARELGVGIVAYSVVTQGLLTGTFPSELPAGDERQIFPRFQGDNLKRNIAAVEGLKQIAKGRDAVIIVRVV